MDAEPTSGPIAEAAPPAEDPLQEWHSFAKDFSRAIRGLPVTDKDKREAKEARSWYRRAKELAEEAGDLVLDSSDFEDAVDEAGAYT